jgi:hypothetical protein
MLFAFVLLGNEHQGGRHCYKAYDRGFKPGWTFPNLVVCNCFSYMHNNSVSLPEQGTTGITLYFSYHFLCLFAFSHIVKLPGTGYFQYCSCLSYLLCNVHVPHNFSQCHNVQGEIILKTFGIPKMYFILVPNFYLLLQLGLVWSECK